MVDAAVNAWFAETPRAALIPDPHEHFRERMRAALIAAGWTATAAAAARDAARQQRLIDELSKIVHNMVVADQAAWIEWRHGRGAEAAMQWIGNGLLGPGHIPAEDEPYSTEAQAWYDAHRADAFPACQCGRPSNILHMGSGYCCDEHYRAAIAQQSQRKEA
ncbi:hypothetical protein [Achromobacter sp. AGC39]